MKWPLRRLSELGTVSTGSTPPTSESRFYGGDLPFVTPAELDTGFPITTTPRTLTDEGAAEARVLPEGAVMVCCIGSLGKIGIAGRAVATNQQINSVIFDSGQVLPGFGFYACRLLKPKLECMAPATTLPIVSKSKFADLTIPVPPLAEQRRIADVLDRAEVLRAKRCAALAQLDSLTQSIFLDLFGDPASNPKGWPAIQLGHVIFSASDGPHVSPHYVESGVPFLSTRHVRPGDMSWNDLKFISREDAETHWKKCKPERGDILYTKGGTTGIAKVVDFDEEVAIWVHIALLKTDRSKVEPLWLEAMLNSPFCYSQSQRLTHGIANRDLGLTRMVKISMFLPPLSLQSEFRRRVEALKKLKKTQRASLAELDALFATLQHRAFNGELFSEKDRESVLA